MSKEELEKQSEQIGNLAIKLTKFFIKEKYTPEESLLTIIAFLHERLDICPNKEE